MSKAKIISISGMVMALYVATMYATSGFAFGAYQIRIATSLYSLSFVFPFLVLPLALANSLSNFLTGSLGGVDIVGGFIVGIVTAGLVYTVKRFTLPRVFIIPVIIFAPALIVPVWLSYLLELPYTMLAVSLTIGQILPAIAGYFLTFAAERILKHEHFSFRRGD
jgi:uncharacterized membrane protein